MPRENRRYFAWNSSGYSKISWLFQFVIVAASVEIAAAARLHLNGLLADRAPLAVFVLSVMFSTWFSGWKGGVFATLLSDLNFIFYLAPSQHIVATGVIAATIAPFSILGLVISLVGQAQIDGQRRIERQARDAEQAAEVLRESERRRQLYEQQLAASEERLRLAVEGANIGTWHWKIQSDELVWSDMMFALNGRPAAPLNGIESFLAVLHPDDVERARDAMSAAMTEKTSFDIEVRIVWPDGSLRWQVARGRAYFDDVGEPVRMEGIVFDVTALKRAEQEAHSRAEREALVRQIEQAWRMTLNPDQIQDVAVRTLAETLNVDRCYFSIFSDDETVTVGDDYHHAEIPSLAGVHRLAQFEVDPKEYFPNGETLVIRDVREWEFPKPLVDAIERLHVRATVNVPLFNQAQLAATLTVAMAFEARDWTEEEVRLVETVAAQTRLAIESANAQEREHRIATELQNALLPDLPERVPGLELASVMMPALDEALIGGDFCDVYPLTPRTYAVIVGDVSGKGLAAGAQLAAVRNMLRCLLYEHADVAKAASRLNAIACANGLLVGFVTAFVGIYDVQTGAVQFVSCGHEPMIIQRAGRSAPEVHGAGGLPLGVDDSARYTMQAIRLAPGDTLLLYTDGLTEAGPNRNQMLRSDGLATIFSQTRRTLPPEDIAQQIVDNVSRYARIGFLDDVCVLVARREDPESYSI